ncbi:MAG: 1-phosphofructokinase family hexose kinase [Rhodanobacteraceae bacterium]
MITVVGFNTAIDRRVDLGALQPGRVQRAVAAEARPGGKGLHVAETVAALGEPVTLVGLTDAAHADALRNRLHTRGVEWRPVHTARPLRQCLAIHEADGRVTEILEPGATLDSAIREALLGAVRSALDESNVLVFSGSLPRGFASDTYAGLIREASARGVRCLLDASGEALREGIVARPWLVKPNVDEAASLLGRRVDSMDDAVDCARELHRHGVARAVVTLGAAGAVGFDGEGLWRATSAPAEVRNSVGSGDCFLAGLAVGAVRDESIDVALRRAVACGAANAESADTGCVSLDRVAAWLPRVRVEAVPAGIGSRLHP